MAQDETLIITVHYPGHEPIALRTEHDWTASLAPVRRDPGTRGHVFEVPAASHVYFKPVIDTGTSVQWAQGPNLLAVAGQPRTLVAHPYFRSDARCSVCTLDRIDSAIMGASVRLRVFLPPGYEEATMRAYPVLYMQDGHNVFFPEEAAFGEDWKLRETLAVLTEMNQVEPLIVVGITPNDRMAEYTAPGYVRYGRFVIEELAPLVAARYRTLRGPANTAVMGSSLGGVVSFYLGWEYPEAFGAAGCLSSTFGYRDDLLTRVATEPRRPTRFYLDSGFPRDNFETTRVMRAALVRRGHQEGTDLLYFGFPNALHNERSWATRCHLPLQFFFGRNG